MIGSKTMQPLQNVLTDQSNSSTIDSDFFNRPPLRSYYFLMGTFTMFMALACGCIVVVRYWNELPTMSIAQMGLATTTLVILWFRAYQSFQRLHEVYTQAKLDPSFVRSPIDKVFLSAGNLMSATLYLGFSAAAWFFLALGTALRHH
jgi:hypothetical protein